jgi:putative membrane protein
MKKVILRWIILAISVFAASAVTTALGLGFRANLESNNFGSLAVFLIGVLLLSFLNATLGRILKILTLPLSCITLGLFSLVVNAVILMVAASFNLAFRIEGNGFQAFLAALVSSTLIAFINGVLGAFLPDEKDD